MPNMEILLVNQSWFSTAVKDPGFLGGVYPGSPFLDAVRLIAPDRPGCGFTDSHRNALECWPGDMAEHANYLDIGKFAVFGPSGGVLFALICAWKADIAPLFAQIRYIQWF